MQNIAGIFDSHAQAERLVADLEARGVDHDHISLMIAESARHTLFTKTENEGEKAAKAGAAGAVAGLGLGALLVALGAIGFGTAGVGLFAAGPVVAMLSAGTAGAVVVGIGSALVSAGFSADDANRYEEALKAGKAVIVVHPGDEQEAEAARSILSQAGYFSRSAA